jgi:hypothetical protein
LPQSTWLGDFKFIFLFPHSIVDHLLWGILKRFQVFNADNSLIYVMQNHFTIFLPAGGCGLRDAQEVPTANT